MKKNWRKYQVSLSAALLFILAAFFRLPKLNTLPAGFFPDEAALAYNGWSIWRTGRDEWGQKFPVTLRSFDDYKPAVYAYLTIPFVLLEGLDHAAARYPAALAGSLLPVLLFLWLRRHSKPWLGFSSALIIIFAPWHWEISRTAIEAGVALTLSMGVLLLLSGQKKWQHWLTVVLSLITIFTYHTARLILPWLIILHTIFTQVHKKTRKRITAFGGLLFVLGITLSLTASSERFRQISIFNDRGGLALRMEAIREDGVAKTPMVLTRAFHNKPMTWLRLFAKSYFKQTSLTYLFWGGTQPPRVEIPDTGQFLLILAPFFLLGLVGFIRRLDKFSWLILLWLLIAPLPASLTSAEIPHTYRTLFMLPVTAIIIASGLQLTWKIAQKKLPRVISYSLGVSFSLLFLANTAQAWHQYAVHQQLNQPWHRQYGYQELFSYLNFIAQKQPESNFYVTQTEKEPYIYLLYYTHILPEVYQQQPEKRLAHRDIEQGENSWKLFNYTFAEQACPHDYGPGLTKDFYVVNKTCELPKDFVRICQVSFKDKSAMFFVDSPQEDKKDQAQKLNPTDDSKVKLSANSVIPHCEDLLLNNDK